MPTATARPRSQTATATMRAAVIAAPGEVVLRDVPRPEPGPTEVRVRLEGCGVCASNLPVWQGREWFDYPLEPGAPGHEGWGVVDAIGDDVTQAAVGDRVAFLGYHSFAEYDVCDEHALAVLPEELADVPFPGEPLGCAMNVFARGDVRAGQVVAVVGVGFLGALLVRLAKSAGARVIAISNRDSALELARHLGADHVLKGDDTDAALQTVRELTDGKGCDRVIEATGYEAPLQLASELVRVRGRLVIAGFHQDGPRTIDLQSWNWRGIDVINAHERDPRQYVAGMQAAIDAVREGKLDFQPLLTHVVPLEELGDVLNLANERPTGFLKAAVQMESFRTPHSAFRTDGATP